MGFFYFFHIILFSFVARSFYTLASQDVEVNKFNDDLLYCHFCGLVVGDTSQIVYIPSVRARHVENRKILGKSIIVQTLENPFKFFFDVVTTSKANCFEDGLNMRADSWFPGYSWRVCKCPRCKYHLGWTFEGAMTNNLEDTDSKKSFHALILQALYGLVENSTTERTRSETLQNMRATDESLPLFLDTPVQIMKPQMPTPAVTKNTTAAKTEEPINTDNTAGATIVILKKRARNVTSNGTQAESGTHNATVPVVL